MNFWDVDHELLALRRGKNRTARNRELILETLKCLGEKKPTRDELQKLAKVQRKRFISTLKQLLESGKVMRFGQGTKNSPFRYSLAPEAPKRRLYFGA